MIDAVLLFGVLNIFFEFVVLSMVPPRTRLRVLGSPVLCALLHFTMLALNLIVHWGTLVGSMSAILAFCASLLTVRIAQLLYGTVRGRVYKRGLISYSVEELR